MHNVDATNDLLQLFFVEHVSCHIHICLFVLSIFGQFRSIFVKLNSWKNQVFGDKISSCTDLQSYDVQCCMSSRFRKPVTTDVVSVRVIPSSCFVWQFQILFELVSLLELLVLWRFFLGFIASRLFLPFSGKYKVLIISAHRAKYRILVKSAKSNAMSFY